MQIVDDTHTILIPLLNLTVNLTQTERLSYDIENIWKITI